MTSPQSTYRLGLVPRNVIIFKILIGRKMCLFGLWKSVNDTHRRYCVSVIFGTECENQSPLWISMTARTEKDFQINTFLPQVPKSTSQKLRNFPNALRSSSPRCLIFAFNLRRRLFEESRGAACFSLPLWFIVIHPNWLKHICESTRWKNVTQTRYFSAPCLLFSIYKRWNMLGKCLRSSCGGKWEKKSSKIFVMRCKHIESQVTFSKAGLPTRLSVTRSHLG